jgi:hypothetical protein
MDTRQLLSEPTPIRIRSTRHASKYFSRLPNLSHTTPLRRTFVITVTTAARDKRRVAQRIATKPRTAHHRHGDRVRGSRQYRFTDSAGWRIVIACLSGAIRLVEASTCHACLCSSPQASEQQAVAPDLRWENQALLLINGQGPPKPMSPHSGDRRTRLGGPRRTGERARWRGLRPTASQLRSEEGHS